MGTRMGLMVRTLSRRGMRIGGRGFSAGLCLRLCGGGGLLPCRGRCRSTPGSGSALILRMVVVNHHVVIRMLIDSRRRLAHHQRAHLNLPRSMPRMEGNVRMVVFADADQMVVRF